MGPWKKWRYKQLTDEELGKLNGQGDRLALTELHQRYGESLWGFYARRCGDQQLARDLCQEVWDRLIRKGSTYNPERPFRAWFWTLARNRWIDNLRENTKPLEEFQEELVADISEDIVASLIQSETAQVLSLALDKLKPIQRECLELWLEDLSYQEIAEITESTVDSVKAHLKRARNVLVTLVKEEV